MKKLFRHITLVTPTGLLLTLFLFDLGSCRKADEVVPVFSENKEPEEDNIVSVEKSDGVLQQ